MIAITIAILILVLITVFLLSAALSSQSGQEFKGEYRNLYAHNMLLSMLRTETDCGSFSDVLKAAYFGGGKCDSDEFMESRLPVLMASLLNATGHTEYEWFLEASPENFQGSELSYGKEDVKQSLERWDARTMITWEGYRLEVKLYIRTSG